LTSGWRLLGRGLALGLVGHASAAPATPLPTDLPVVGSPSSETSPAVAPLERARLAYFDARRLMAESRFEEVLPLLEGLLEITPTWSLAKLALAQTLRSLDREPDRRARLLAEAIEVDPDNHQLLYELGLSHEERREPAEAIRRYRQAVVRRPDLTHAHERLGALLLEAGELDEARGHLEVAAAQRPTNPVTVSLLAVGFEGLHRPDDAERQLKRLIVLAPQQPYLYSRLAAFYLRHGRQAESAAAQATARRLLERAAPQRPKMRPLGTPPRKKR